MTTQEQVLAVLLDAPDTFVSGESLAHTAGVSRNAVWKAVSALRADGYEIEAVTNRGYRLQGERESISEAGICKWLKTKCFGRKMEIRSVVDSTNARARELARLGAPEGTMAAARGQTEGRGRMGRKFQSPADSGIYISFVLRPEFSAARSVKLTVLTAVAVARAIERIAPVHADIKWVNDIYLDGRKTAGILCESETDPRTGMPLYTVVGIGVNVSQRVFPDELKGIATSIGNVCGMEISKNRLIAEICGEMETLLSGSDYLKEYRERSIVPGHRVRVIDGDADYFADALAIDDDASLIVKTEFGLRTLRAGEVRIMRG